MLKYLMMRARAAKVRLSDDTVVETHDSRGATKTSRQDQFTEIMDLHVSKLIDAVTILANTAIDDTEIGIETTGVTPVIGDLLCLKESTSFYQGGITAVTPIAGNQYTVAIDTPLDFAYTVVGGCSLRTDNLAVNGAVTTQVFSVSPEGLTVGTSWDITRSMIYIEGTGAMDDGLFGDEPPLPNGLVFRSTNGITKNIYNVKTNGEFVQHNFDREYSTRAPAGVTSVSSRRSFNGEDKNGVVIRLTSEDIPGDSDRFDVLIRDDLSGLTELKIVIQGHVVED